MDQARRPLDIHRQLLELIDAGRPFVLALILRADGSTPQQAGVKALIEPDGRIRGTLGGGIVEGLAQRRAAEVCRSGQALVFDCDLTQSYARDGGPICGGAMRILLDPGAARFRECYAAAAQALEQRRRGALLTRVQATSPPGVTVQWIDGECAAEGLSLPGTEAVRECIDKETARLFVEDTPASHVNPEPLKMPLAAGETTGMGAVEVLVEPVLPRPVLLIAGGGHVGQALARLAAFNDYDVTVFDDRPEFTAPELYPAAVATRCGEIPREVAAFAPGRDTSIVIVTRGHKQDAEVLEACIHSPAAYLGMIGSRRKVAMLRQHFVAAGLATEAEWARVMAPVGLDIGAITVPEIATSIMAQIIAVRRKGAAYDPASGMVRR